MKNTRWLATLALLSGAWLWAGDDTAPAAPDGAGKAYLLEIRGPIGPATSDYVLRGMEKATDAGASLIVLTMDTPGGLDTAMREIIKGILGSTVPVVSFVHPSGSRAASAGTFILYASHIAAMAPATNLGAATPVAIGGPPPRPPGRPGIDPDDPGDAGDAGEETGGKPAAGDDADAPGSALERKALNDSIAYIRSLAETRGRNADWAEQAVRHAASLSATAALEDNVIDLIANDLSDLLEALDGRTVSVNGKDRTLATRHLIVERVDPDWRTRLLATITNPTIAYGLLLIGIYGLIFEGYNPGAVLPGVVGAIALLLALYALQVLSVNYAGLGLIVLGIVLMISEVFVASFGALGIGGIVAFVIGSIILIDTEAPGFGVPVALIGTMATVGGSLVMAIVWFAVRARRRPVVTGREQLLDATAEALSNFDEEGRVRVHGEIWQARTRVPVQRGQTLRIMAIDGLWLEVEPRPEQERPG